VKAPYLTGINGRLSESPQADSPTKRLAAMVMMRRSWTGNEAVIVTAIVHMYSATIMTDGGIGDKTEREVRKRERVQGKLFYRNVSFSLFLYMTSFHHPWQARHYNSSAIYTCTVRISDGSKKEMHGSASNPDDQRAVPITRVHDY